MNIPFFYKKTSTEKDQDKKNAKELFRFTNDQFKKLAEKNLSIPVKLFIL